MKEGTLILFFLITHKEEDSLDLLEFSGGKLCELVGVSRSLYEIVNIIDSVPGLCSYNDIEIAKKRRDELQKDYDKKIMIFKLLIKTESELLG